MLVMMVMLVVLVMQGKAPKLQWEIMRMLDIDDASIPAFADPEHWLEYVAFSFSIASCRLS